MNDVPDFYAVWAAKGGGYTQARHTVSEPRWLECQCCGRSIDPRHEDTYKCDDEYDCVCARCCLEYHKNEEIEA